MTSEIKRTCRKCGTVWYVTTKEARAKAPSGAELTVAGLADMFDGGGTAAGLEARKARVDAANRCSQCGSMDFSEAGSFDAPAPKLSREERRLAQEEEKLARVEGKARVARIKQYIAEQKALGHKISWSDASALITERELAAAESNSASDAQEGPGLR